MRLEIFLLGITAFLVYNTYHDGKYTKMLFAFQKYYKMFFFICLGMGIYMLLKRNPIQGRQMLHQANNFIKYMPLSKNVTKSLQPIINMTASAPLLQPFTNNTNTNTNTNVNPSIQHYPTIPNQNQHINQQYQTKQTKRSVSETKKKYVAASQNWKCGQCQMQLNHTFEVDHKIRLEYGGSNEADNLIALCRNCHGMKTASENM